jgi:hypothetical protein
MKTMRRIFPPALVIPSLVAAVVVTGLAALTGTGAGGTYILTLLGLPVLILYLHWPEVREGFQAKPSPPRSRTKSQ